MWSHSSGVRQLERQCFDQIKQQSILWQGGTWDWHWVGCFFGPSKLTLPFGWVQKQDYTKTPTKGCPSGVRTLSSPSWRY